jgi:uncharacterized membrane protein
VYWLAQKHLRDSRAASLFALAYLAYPATQYNAYTPDAGFHAVSLAIPLLLFAIWFLDEDRLAPFTVCALLAAASKEQIPAAVACLGVWYAVRRGHRVFGGTVAVVGLTASLVSFEVLIPHFAVGGFEPFSDRYREVGGTPGGILIHAFTNPGSLLGAVFTAHKLLYLLLVFAPFLGLSLLEPWLLFGAAPDLAINLLSSKAEQTTVEFQYTAGIVPFVVAGAIVGLSRLRQPSRWVGAAACAAAVGVALYSSPLVTVSGDARTVLGENAGRAARTHALRFIPATVPVSASKHLAANLSARRRIFVFPVIGSAKWVIVDVHDPLASPQVYNRAVAQIDASPEWRLLYSSQGVQVLQRRLTR